MIIVVLFMLANPMQFIILKVLCLMVVNLYKMHYKQITIENRVYNCYFDYYIKSKKQETKNIFIDEKNYKDMVIYFTRYDR